MAGRGECARSPLATSTCSASRSEQQESAHDIGRRRDVHTAHERRQEVRSREHAAERRSLRADHDVGHDAPVTRHAAAGCPSCAVSDLATASAPKGARRAARRTIDYFPMRRFSAASFSSAVDSASARRRARARPSISPLKSGFVSEHDRPPTRRPARPHRASPGRRTRPVRARRRELELRIHLADFALDHRELRLLRLELPLEQRRALRMLFLVALGDRHRLGILDPFGELLPAPNGFELGPLAGEPGARLLHALSQVVEPHPRLHERLAHLRDDRATGIAAGRRAAQQIAKGLANVVKHAGEERGSRAGHESGRLTDIDLSATPQPLWHAVRMSDHSVQPRRHARSAACAPRRRRYRATASHCRRRRACSPERRIRPRAGVGGARAACRAAACAIK